MSASKSEEPKRSIPSEFSRTTTQTFIANLPITILLFIFVFFNTMHLPVNEYTTATDSNLLWSLYWEFCLRRAVQHLLHCRTSHSRNFSDFDLVAEARRQISKRFVISAMASAVIGYSFGLGLWNSFLHGDCLSPCHFWGMSAVAARSTSLAPTASSLSLALLSVVPVRMLSSKRRIRFPFIGRLSISRAGLNGTCLAGPPTSAIASLYRA